MKFFRVPTTVLLLAFVVSASMVFTSSSCSNTGNDKTSKNINEDDPNSYNSGPDKYQIIVRTGCEDDAGTKAKVYCILKGDKGNSKEFVLDNPLKEEFNACSRDVFEVKLNQDIGTLTGLFLWHDNTGENPSFKPEIVDVVYMKNAKKWGFPCGKWFDSERFDKQLKREFFDYRECK